MNVFFDLQWLVGGMRDDQVRRKNLVQLSKFPVDGLTERRDLPLVSHVDRQRDRTTALPSPLWVLPGVVVQVLSGALVAATDFDQVTEINRCAGRRCGHSNITYRVYVFELTGRVENYLLLPGLERAPGSNDVTSTKHGSKRRWLEPVRGQPSLRIFKVDHLRQYASPFHLGRFRRTLNGASNQVRKVVEIGVTVLVARDLGQSLGSFPGIPDDDWFPSIGMQFGSLHLLLKETLDEGMDRRIVSGRDTIYTDKSAPPDQLGRPYDSHLFCLLLEELRGVQYCLVRGKGLRKRVDDGDRRALALVFLRGPRSLHGRLNPSCADVDLDRVRFWTGNGQHERSGVSKITLERDVTGAWRELAVQCIQLEVDVAELPLYVRDIFGKLHVDVGGTGNRDRTDPVVGGCSGMDGLIFSDGVFNRAGNKLLDLLRGRAGP